jgi:hypothetical protein
MGGPLFNNPRVARRRVIRPSPQAAISQSVVREFPRDVLSVAWRCVQELFQLVAQHGFEPWQLRWVFDQAQLYVVRRPDGQALATFLAKDPAALDAAAVERLFADFRSVKAP